MGMTSSRRSWPAPRAGTRVRAGDVVEPRRGPRHVARERGARDQPVPGDLQGHGARSRGSGTRRRSRSSSTTACRRSRPRRRATRRRCASSSPPTGSRASTTSAATWAASATRSCRERLRASRRGRGGHRLAHHEPRRAGRVRLRHRRHRDGQRLGAGRRRSTSRCRDASGSSVERPLPRMRRPQGPDPAPGRPLGRRGRQLPRDRVPRRDDPRACPPRAGSCSAT